MTRATRAVLDSLIVLLRHAIQPCVIGACLPTATARVSCAPIVGEQAGASGTCRRDQAHCTEAEEPVLDRRKAGLAQHGLDAWQWRQHLHGRR
jgi:hypothetical protein